MEQLIRCGAERTDLLTRLYPLKTNLFPHVSDVLNNLKRKYTLHLISNGTDKQASIMIRDGLKAYIRGALRFGVDALCFNPNKIRIPDIPYQVTNLKVRTNGF